MTKFRISSLDQVAGHRVASTYKKTILPSGLRVISEEIPHVRSVSVGVWVDVGSVHETPETNGITHFLEHMVFKATKHRSTRAIAESLEALGGYLNAFTTKESTCFYARVLDEHLPQAVDVISDLVQSPKLSPSDIEKEKVVVLEELKNVEDDPDEKIQDILEERLFPRHPLGFTVLGREETIRSFDRRALLRHLETWYRAQHTLVVAAGGVRHEELLGHVERYFALPAANGKRQPRDSGKPRVPQAGARKGGAEEIVLRRDVQQAYMVRGRVTQGARGANRHALMVLNTLFGDGMSSRLNQQIRERHGLVYAVYSFLNLMKDVGIFGVSAGTDEMNVEKVSGLLRKEFERLRTRPIPASELERTKSQIKGSTVLGLESMSARMTRLATGELYFGGYVPLESFLSKIDAVTVEDMHAAAGELLDPDGFVGVSILPLLRERST